MNELGSFDSSRKLAPICQKDFINKFYLIFLNDKIPFDVTRAKKTDRTKQGLSSAASKIPDRRGKQDRGHDNMIFASNFRP